MVCFINYTLKLPKSNLDNYIDFILKPIYEIDRKDLLFLNNNDQEEDWTRTNRIELIKETEEYYQITFKLSTFTALANVLPTTIIGDNTSLCTNIEVLDKIKETLQQHHNLVTTDVGLFYEEIIPFAKEDVSNLIKQLAIDGTIHKYFELDEGVFLCVFKRLPLIIYTRNSELKSVIADFMIFDIDDGFLHYDLDEGIVDVPNSKFTIKLNGHFRSWKEKGDIKANVIPINDLRD